MSDTDIPDPDPAVFEAPAVEVPVAVGPNNTEWDLEGDASGEELDPNSPEVLEARRAAGDPTAPEEV